MGLIEEVHLSRNVFTDKGVEALVEAADRDLSQIGKPLWLRVEHNQISDPEDFVRMLDDKFQSVCSRADRSKCLPGCCVYGCRIHVPFLVEKRNSKKRKRP